MLDRVLGAASVLSMLVGAVSGPADRLAEVAFSFQDPAIIESSGLVVSGDLFLTVNDSGDRGRVFVVDRSGRTVGVTSWADEPTDVESLAPAGPGEVWVGDTGDNRRGRDSITVLRVPYGTGDREVTPTAYELVYPDRAHDAETLLADPRTGQLLVVSKDVFGGTVYAAPKRLSADRPNRLRAVGAGFAFATDGSFFPDGRHYVVRGYASAAVYTFPGHESLGTFDLPPQQQGEGIAVGGDDRLYLSSEGEHSEVLRMRLPAAIASAMGPSPRPTSASTSTPTATPGSTPGPAPAATGSAPEPDGGAPVWPWAAGGALVFVAGAGWLLMRRGQAS
ncbi:hypothetical protein [Nocardioides sp. URHA0020]|uniref:hypothetical protein n=1 Tax=Nocardioides sp. URHA0020 TaxID=1380392 RepID=UPI000686385C|nr:hypothetical protein [Nocardioides sp. URHA0020]